MRDVRLTQCWAIACVLACAMAGPVQAQCTECDGACPEVFDHYEAPCGTGLNYGQSFTASITGYLNSITIARCSGVNAQLVVRQYNGEGPAWNQGSLIGEADQVIQGTGEPMNCFVSGGNGFSHYLETTFTFTDLGLEAGSQYVFELTQGVAATGCTVSYDGGTAYALSGAKPDEDLVFRVSMCPLLLNFGCTDPEACNFDVTANVEDGSCLQLDCQGTCGGTAHLDPQCGCLPSIEDAGTCLGCTDPDACNFDPSASVEDGSCEQVDCNGDCGGNATSSDCGCIGGNTGIPASACIEGCLTEVTGSSPEACSPGILYGQSFTPDVNGLLERVRLKTCCALDAQLVIRKAANLDPCNPTGPEAWNSGDLLGTSNLNSKTCSGLGACLTVSGVEGYIWRNFDFTSVPLQAGQSYVLELVSGVAVASCSSDYPQGNAFNTNGPLADKDLVFSLNICSENLIWGCTDSESCNFDPAANQNDGSCLYLDCDGVCGGTAQWTEGCGCIGGTTGIRVEQCINGTLFPIHANDAAICTGSLTGQTLTLDSDGFLTGLYVYGAPDQTQSLSLERSDGPLSGSLVFSASRQAQTTECADVPASWISIPLPASPVQAGSGYRLEFTQGSGRTTCSADYTEGTGLQNGSPVANADLAFRLVYREPEPGELVWGCTTEGHCNFDPAATHDDGSCAQEDCNGDCGGTAYFVQGCGCVDGLTGRDEASCYGCMDASKCNFSPQAAIEDGSCLDFDCNGDCGGMAVPNEHCGCVGGETGVDPALCLDKCQSEPSLSTYPTEFPDGNYGLGGSGQSFTATATAYLTAFRFRQGNEPSTSLTVELRALDGPQPGQGTLLASELAGDWTSDPSGGGDMLLEWTDPVLLEAGLAYSLTVIGSATQWLQSAADVYAEGASFGISNAAPDGPDFYFQLFTCDDLFGCTDPVACNTDPWATADDGGCTYPDVGLDCAGNACTPDADGDGICAALDSDDANPFVCMDSDVDGCDDCSSGQFNPSDDGEDDDGDGICNATDSCSDINADNYASPDNEVCRGECDTAPIYHSIALTSVPSAPNSEDGLVTLDLEGGNLPFAPPAAFDAVRLVMDAFGDSESMTITLDGSPILVHPGIYRTQVFNDAGCPGVASAPNGTAFGQPPVVHWIHIGHALQGAHCLLNDADQDGICDEVDQCMDPSSSLLDHPDNLPCE